MEGPVAMAVGSRAHLEADALARRHWFRNFLMRGFHLLVMFVAGGAVRDTQCGFKVCLLLHARRLPHVVSHSAQKQVLS